MEYLGISMVFGERAKEIPVSSNKSMVGHTLSAAGAVEAVFSLLTLEHQRIPPTINYDVPDPAIPFDVVPNKARDARVNAVMSNSVRIRRPERLPDPHPASQCKGSRRWRSAVDGLRRTGDTHVQIYKQIQPFRTP